MMLPQPKTKAGFFALEHTTWEKLNVQTKGLPRAAWTESNAAGKWSLKDVYAHLADWMIETRGRVPKMLRDEKLPRISIPEFNRACHARNQKLTTAQARQRLTLARQALLRFLKTLSEDDLLHNKPVYTWAAWSTFNHYAEHIPNLARFRRAVPRRAK